MATITEDYVSFEVAKLMVKNGFNGICRSYFITNGNEYRYCEIPLTNKNMLSDQCLRPTIQMAMKWLREEHNIHISIYLFDRDHPITENTLYTCDIATNKISSKYGHLRGIWKSYEEVCEVAIKYCLETLIE